MGDYKLLHLHGKCFCDIDLDITIWGDVHKCDILKDGMYINTTMKIRKCKDEDFSKDKDDKYICDLEGVCVCGGELGIYLWHHCDKQEDGKHLPLVVKYK